MSWDDFNLGMVFVLAIQGVTWVAVQWWYSRERKVM